MSKVYEKANTDVSSVMQLALRKWHGELKAAGVEIAILMVEPDRNENGTPKGPALKHAGYPAAAVVSLLNPKHRLLTGKDAVIEVDAEVYHRLTGDEALALFDHELEHVVIEDGKHDDLRPKLSIRDHDVVVFGFESVMRRHQMHALESTMIYRAAKSAVENCQLSFDFLMSPVVAE